MAQNYFLVLRDLSRTIYFNHFSDIEISAVTVGDRKTF